jgi:type I restriction enzyme S subunit
VSEELPVGWERVTVADVADVVTGTTRPTKDRSSYGGATPFLKPTDLDMGNNITSGRETLSDTGRKLVRLVPAGSTLLTCIGTIGKAGFAGAECATNQQINALVPRPTVIEPRWLYWRIIGADFQEQLVANSSATTIAIINKGRVERLSFGLPPLPEQRRIVARIEALFARTRRARADLERVAPLAFRHREQSLAAALIGDLSRPWRGGSDPVWELRKAAGLFEWSSGKFLPKKAQVPGEFPVYGGNGVNGFHSESITQTPSLIIGRVGAHCGNVHVAEMPAWITDNAIYAKK